MKRSRKIETVCSVSSNGGSLFLFLLIQRTTCTTPVVNLSFLICQTQCATGHVRFKKNWTVCELSIAYIYIYTHNSDAFSAPQGFSARLGAREQIAHKTFSLLEWKKHLCNRGTGKVHLSATACHNSIHACFVQD